MKYVLDTHAALWIAEDSDRLSPRVRALARSQAAGALGIAAISLLEIARKVHDGEITHRIDPAAWLAELAVQFETLPLTPQIAWQSVGLDWAHRDPADRVIVATTQCHGRILVTHDKEIARWGGVPVFW